MGEVDLMVSIETDGDLVIAQTSVHLALRSDVPGLRQVHEIQFFRNFGLETFETTRARDDDADMDPTAQPVRIPVDLDEPPLEHDIPGQAELRRLEAELRWAHSTVEHLPFRGHFL